jgi:hypothetical protein
VNWGRSIATVGVWVSWEGDCGEGGRGEVAREGRREEGLGEGEGGRAALGGRRGCLGV